MSRQAAGFEANITFGLVLMILNLANGPKLNGPFVPLAVGESQAIGNVVRPVAAFPIPLAADLD